MRASSSATYFCAYANQTQPNTTRASCVTYLYASADKAVRALLLTIHKQTQRALPPLSLNFVHQLQTKHYGARFLLRHLMIVCLS
jgi:hypothetical protein